MQNPSSKQEVVASAVANLDINETDSSAPETEDSEGEETDEDDCTSPKSRDDTHGKSDCDDDDDEYDPSAGASTDPIIITDTVRQSASDAEVFVEDEVLQKMIDGATTRDEMKKALDICTKKAIYYGKMYKSANQNLKDYNRKQKIVAKSEEKKAERERLFTLNVRINGLPDLKSVSVNGAMTVSAVRDLVGETHLRDLSRKTLKKCRLIHSTGIVLTDRPRKTVGTLGLRDGDVIDFQVLGAGGARKRSAEASEGDFTVIIKPEALASDPKCVADALKMTQINAEAWVKSLNIEGMKDIVERLDGQPRSGNVASLVSPLLPHVVEFKALAVLW